MLINILKNAFEKKEEAEPSANPFPHAKERSVVVVGYGVSRSDPFKSIAATLTEVYADLGLHCYLMDMLHTSWPNRALEEMFDAGQIRYGMGWGGIGWDAVLMPPGQPSMNAWATTRTPFFKIIGDHPAYFLDVSTNIGPAFVNIYAYPEHRDFFVRHINQGFGATAPIQPLDPLEPEELDFKAKETGPVVFLKNGNDPDALRRAWQGRMPPHVAKALLEMSEELLSTLPREREWRIESLVVKYFDDFGLYVADKVKFLAFYIAQMDDYLRRVKSQMIAESLLDFPIEVHGECWEHLDFSGKKAKLIPFGNYVRSSQLMKEALCVLDMPPNTRSYPHERFVRCASRHTLCLTSHNDLLEKQFAPLGQPLFEFTPDSIREHMSAVLEDPVRHVQIGRAVGEQFARLYPRNGLVHMMEALADELRVQEGEHPGLQGFLVWPPKKIS
jgi:hypothetical protein